MNKEVKASLREDMLYLNREVAEAVMDLDMDAWISLQARCRYIVTVAERISAHVNSEFLKRV